jgi:predicted metal-dependent hydrolase
MNGELPCALRRSPRAKRLRLVVKAEGAELVVPPSIGEEQALAFLSRHRAWAERKIAELRGRLAVAPPSLIGAGATVPFQGREVPLVVAESPRRGSRVEFDGRFLVSIPQGAPEQVEPRVKAALYAWIEGWLRREADRIASSHAERHGLRPRQFRIKRMKTRWGSCGGQGDINLNWLLAFAPPPVLEYVVVHELCHLRHRDHSAAFWALVARHLPDWPERRQWLKRQGGELLRRFG